MTSPRIRLRFLLYPVLVFLVGAAAGAGLTALVRDRQPAPIPPEPQPKPVTPPPLTRTDVDALLQAQLADFVKQRHHSREIARRIFLAPHYVSGIESQRNDFLFHNLYEDGEHPTPIERIRAYDEFVVWIRPVLSDTLEVGYFIGIGWTAEGPELFYCRHALR